MIDASNSDKLEESGSEIINLLNNQVLKKKPLLFLANKSDKKESKDLQELVDFFGLHDIHDREWLIVECSAKTGIGLYEGIIWLINRV